MGGPREGKKRKKKSCSNSQNFQKLGDRNFFLHFMHIHFNLNLRLLTEGMNLSQFSKKKVLIYKQFIIVQL